MLKFHGIAIRPFLQSINLPNNIKIVRPIFCLYSTTNVSKLHLNKTVFIDWLHKKEKRKLLNNYDKFYRSKPFNFSFHTSNNTNDKKYDKNSIQRGSTLNYIIAIGVLVLGLSYAAVPLYRIFCQAYSYGGTTQQDLNTDKIQHMKKAEDRKLKIKFNADIAASMQWNFKPQQSAITVVPGETALAFYSARNPTEKPVIGVSTYNVLPFDAGQYFNKIQCFCFEEQMLNANEAVSMPVFFYIDPEFVDDPKMENVNEITLSYTFFEVKEGMNIPLPGFMKPK